MPEKSNYFTFQIENFKNNSLEKFLETAYFIFNHPEEIPKCWNNSLLD